MNNILCKTSLSAEVRRVLKLAMTCESESLTISRICEESCGGCRDMFYRRLMTIPWTDKHEDILREVYSQMELVIPIRRRQATVFACVIRRKWMHHGHGKTGEEDGCEEIKREDGKQFGIMTMEKLGRKMGVGRPREKMLNNLVSWQWKHWRGRWVWGDQERRCYKVWCVWGDKEEDAKQFDVCGETKRENAKQFGILAWRISASEMIGSTKDGSPWTYMVTNATDCIRGFLNKSIF